MKNSKRAVTYSYKAVRMKLFPNQFAYMLEKIFRNNLEKSGIILRIICD